MTIKEAILAINGHMASQGIKPKKMMTRNEFLDLVGKSGKRS